MTNHQMNDLVRADRAIVKDIGKCIYCREQRGGNLSREHVIPRGLGGGVILRRASCDFHRGITQKIEETILSHTFGAFRHQHLMPTGKKKNRPTHFPITIRDGKTFAAHKVKSGDYPDFLIMPIFQPPGVVTDAPIGPIRRTGWRFSRNSEHFVESLKRIEVSPNSEVLVKFDVGAFVRMIAKIAHGIIWADFDGDRFEPSLIGIIDGDELADAGYLIGCSAVDLEPTIKNSHVYSCFPVETNDPDTLFIHVRIRLWAALGSPTYSIIAGVIRRGVHGDW